MTVCVAHGVDVALLARGLRADASCARARTSVVSTSVGRWSAFNISMLRPTPSRSSTWPCFEQRHQLLEEAPDAVGLGLVAA